MKLYIRAAQYIDSSHLTQEFKSEFGDYVDKVFVYNVDETDRRYNCGVSCKLSSKLRNKYVERTAKCPIDDDTLNILIDEVKEEVSRLVEQKEEGLRRTKDLASKGLKRMTANSYTRYILKKELGLVNKSFAAPKDGSAYLLYDLPFSDISTGEVDDQSYEEFKQEFLDILNDLSDEFGFTFFDVQTPSGGMISRSKWSYQVYGPDVIVEKRTNRVVEIDK